MGPTIFFDAIETVFSLAPLDRKLQDCGLPELSGPTLFAQILRDAFAVSATGRFVSFPEMARENIRVLLETYRNRLSEPFEIDSAIDHIVSAFSELPAHGDVEAAFRAVKDKGFKVCLLTNGPAEGTQKLTQQAGLQSLVDEIISVEDFQQWKPAPELYLSAARSMGLSTRDRIDDAVLIAAHAWDINGAAAAGMRGVWVRRQDASYHQVMAAPLACVDSLEEAVQSALASF